MSQGQTQVSVEAADNPGGAASGSDQRYEGDKVEEDDDDKKRDEFLVTRSQCYLSRRASLKDSANVEFKGRTVIERDCELRGDVGIIKVGRYVWLRPGTTLHPGTTSDAPSGSRNTTKSVPMVIGSHTTIDRDCYISAAAIGSYCWIGKRVKLGQRVIIKDCCVVLDDVVLGDDTVIPPFTLVQSTAVRTTQCSASAVGSSDAQQESLLPAWSHAPTFRCMELPPSTPTEMQERSTEQYAAFVAAQGGRSS